MMQNFLSYLKYLLSIRHEQWSARLGSGVKFMLGWLCCTRHRCEGAFAGVDESPEHVGKGGCASERLESERHRLRGKQRSGKATCTTWTSHCGKSDVKNPVAPVHMPIVTGPNIGRWGGVSRNDSLAHQTTVWIWPGINLARTAFNDLFNLIW